MLPMQNKVFLTKPLKSALNLLLKSQGTAVDLEKTPRVSLCLKAELTPLELFLKLPRDEILQYSPMHLSSELF